MKECPLSTHCGRSNIPPYCRCCDQPRSSGAIIPVPTNPAAHYAGDLLAWVAAALAARWQHQRWPEQAAALSKVVSPSYFIALALGALAGAWLLGSANSLRSLVAAPSHSIAGALAGGIVAVELWKRRARRPRFDRRRAGAAARDRDRRRAPRLLLRRPARLHLRQSRPPCRGRWTSATASAAIPSSSTNRWPWPVFAAVYVHARLANADWARRHAFHALIIFYAGQRFLWEFLKPYPAVLGPLNVFHLLMLGLIAYGLLWWGRGVRRERRSA